MPKRLDARSKVRIEASTLNVYSQDLLETLEKRDDIKVILITRSLSEVAESWHNQMLKASFIEEGTTLSDLLCSSSTSGLKNYREMLAHGNLIDKWITKLGHKRVFVMDCTELKNNSLRIAALLDKFFDCKLELPEVVPVSNVYSSPRNQLLYKFVRTSFFKRIWYSIESNFPYLRKIRIFLREKILLKKSVKQKEFEIKNHSWLINEENIARDMIVKNRNVWRES
ncbi:hypothetical protein KUL42_41510 [Alteromonas sp. KUL42]|uniref:hypothetical protein n=1 Tax=Alteromonas sp. KUL42 TaxID=2480797 RepID=UPI001035EFA4|nr:hypothetical protein [Alteromonas sp. KUL42]TAP31464.1 hypothetical protein EYR97_20545 [Alteromonas sp. KUL42]GEA09390.1 hypothetical protein KUL42_41510 [Alteromonas sp. KUL42]